MGAKTRGNYPHVPNPEYCCEKCVFGTGEHSEWCEQGYFDSAAAWGTWTGATEQAAQLDGEGGEPAYKWWTVCGGWKERWLKFGPVSVCATRFDGALLLELHWMNRFVCFL